MKNLIKFLPLLFIIYSCSKNQDSNSIQAPLVTIERTSTPIYNIALYLDVISNNENLTLSKKNQMKELSKLIKTDLDRIKLIPKTKKLKQKSRRGNSCIPSGCTQPYLSCIYWAKSWDDLLSKCNGPISQRPNNCQQIMDDYIKNIDEIEATYIKCSRKLNACVKAYCKEYNQGSEL